MNLNIYNLLLMLVILLCVGVISYVGIFAYNQYNLINSWKDDVFLINKDDENSIYTSYALILKDVDIVFDKENDEVNIKNESGFVVYKTKRTNLYGSIELGRFCPTLRLEVSTENPGKISMTGIECEKR